MEGPVLVLGAGGFIGSAIFKELSNRDDVFGTINGNSAWRIGKSPKLIKLDLIREVEWVLLSVAPKTIINCAAYGSFPNEKDPRKIYAVNFDVVSRILHNMDRDCAYVHAGTSSEYGYNSAAPKEHERLTPNSDYAVSKAAASHLVEYFGKHKGYKCCNLRLYAVYGPWEAHSRLIPKLVAAGINKRLPQLVNPYISRDFVYIDDVVKAFIIMGTILHSNQEVRGEAYNVCTGICTSIADLALLAKSIFEIEDDPDYSMTARSWDRISDWYGDPEKISEFWRYRISLRSGILGMAHWFRSMPPEVRHNYEVFTAK